MPATNPQSRIDEYGYAHDVSLGPGVKIMPCRYGCGHLYVCTTRLMRAPGCTTCALNAASENMQQLQAKSGPYYDKWLARMAGWIASQKV